MASINMALILRLEAHHPYKEQTVYLDNSLPQYAFGKLVCFCFGIGPLEDSTTLPTHLISEAQSTEIFTCLEGKSLQEKEMLTFLAV